MTTVASQILAVVVICLALALAVVYEYARAKRRKRSAFRDACRKLDKAQAEEPKNDEEITDDVAPFL